ncbi:hypothetical protein SERLA73DRAFT_166958 [Serpula lacrymans var. lacrymans S7.3]|uniref:Uncharacterized protein n=2 Tax=Serpula lacrymans var. lacrymans TaxID=341189 RepID=F8PS25_SERL3|nr:uncharacterized protein SERLADRAFT_463076 [Serpula lacrymans var. lacrymans S7.9]EGO00691.1 hypothetical protein SERLA73DRAFT_166958 [Serpula lacrymans var. lacrymans S7.3]EGO26244.1 hypothetical protein SERLADRAFT_463076 [Serpula lacrymans var. lacrymans S7.9]
MTNDVVNEDKAPKEYAYYWSQDSSLTLDEFLDKYKPSMVQNDGTKPWIWVKGAEASKKDTGTIQAEEEASALLQEVSKKVEDIKNDASIPVRSNKKTGAKSKKELREQVQTEATDKLKAISIKHGYVSGKWLIFAPPDRVDSVWSSVAKSLVNGPLLSTAAFLTKVATSPESETQHYQHVICLYMPDVYDKNSVTDVMKVLLRNHGVNLSGVKSDLYTVIGLDSKHPSGIPSTVWKNTALMKDTEIKELKDAYFSDLSAAKKVTITKVPEVNDASTVGSKRKPPLKKKEKAKEDDPFASDEDDNQVDEKRRKNEVKMKKAGTSAKKRASESETEEEDVKPKKRKIMK